MGWEVGVDGDAVAAVSQRRGAELRPTRDISGEVPLPIGSREPEFGVVDEDPESAADRVDAAPGDQLPDRIVEDYLRLRAQQPAQDSGDTSVDQVVMLAERRADVTGINNVTRARLLDSGQLGPVAVTVGEGNRRRSTGPGTGC
jgi:hypothetical protein